MTVPGRLVATACAAVAAACAAVLAAPAPAGAAVREYWVAAVPQPWNVVPNGHDAIGDTEFDRDAARFEALVYRRFSRNWRRPLPNRSGGLAGPLIRARVGDTIKVHFQNLDLENPHSMHFHGVDYKPSSDGAYVPGFSGPDAKVDPGEKWTYVLHAGRGSRGVWPYHDHSPSMMESLERGLFGAMSILGRRERAPDREYVTVFSDMGGLSTINGRAFVGNTPIRRARVGDLVQWNVVAIGSDFHTFHVHGHRWMDRGRPRDTQVIGPAESYRFRWRERAPGTWLYHCHVEDHMMHGMIGLYRVKRR